MAVTYKILGQSAPAAGVLSTLYATPATTQAVVSTLTMCNTNSASTATVRVAARPSGASITTSQYLIYDLSMDPLETLTLTLGITLDQTDVLSVQSSSSLVSFSLFGSEVTP